MKERKMVPVAEMVNILEKEMNNRNEIHLYLDGSYWLAYERSAYNLARLHVPVVMEREVIREGIDVILLKASFGINELHPFLTPSVELKLLSDNSIQFVIYTKSEEDFSQWKADQLSKLPA